MGHSQSADRDQAAQNNTRKHLSGIQRVEDWDYNFLPMPASALPSEVFDKEHKLKLNGASSVPLVRSTSASTASRPASVTIASRPSGGTGRWRYVK
jgi:hypothetical protein